MEREQCGRSTRSVGSLPCVLRADSGDLDLRGSFGGDGGSLDLRIAFCVSKPSGAILFSIQYNIVFHFDVSLKKY